MKLPNQMKELRNRVIERDKRTCQYCGKSKLYKAQLTLDHLCSVVSGGQDTDNNLVVACKQCNHRKGTKSVSQYVADRLRQLEREREYLLRMQHKHPA